MKATSLLKSLSAGFFFFLQAGVVAYLFYREWGYVPLSSNAFWLVVVALVVNSWGITNYLLKGLLAIFRGKLLKYKNNRVVSALIEY